MDRQLAVAGCRLRALLPIRACQRFAPTLIRRASCRRGRSRLAWCADSLPSYRDEAKLDSLAQIVTARPVFNNFSVADTVNVDLLGLERLAGRLKTNELSGVSATRDDTNDDFVACNDLILNVVVKIAECIPQPPNRHLQALRSRWCPRAGLMIDEIRMKDLVYDSKVPACEDFIERSL